MRERYLRGCRLCECAANQDISDSELRDVQMVGLTTRWIKQ